MYRTIAVAAGIAAVLAHGLNAATRIRLATGEVLVVDTFESDGATVRFHHPLLGELTLPANAVEVLPEAVDSSMAPEAEPMTSSESPATPPAPMPEPIPAQPPPPKEWKFKLVIGGSLSDGNTENAKFAGTFEAVRETEKMKTALDTGFFFGSSDGDRDENRFTAGGRHDWLNPGHKIFYFADARYDIDEFQSWDSRASGHIGLGYKFIEPPPFKLNGLLGIGIVKEWGSDNEDVRPEALAGIEGEYTFAEKHSIVFSSIAYPDLNDLGEYRWVSSAKWAFLLDKETKLSLNAGVEHEYQSVVDADREHNDLRVTAGLGLEF